MLWAVLGIVLAIAILFLVTRGRRQTRSKLPPGIALLLKSPVILSQEQLRRAFESEFGSLAELERQEGDAPPAFRCLFRIKDETMRVSCSPAPPLPTRQKLAAQMNERRGQEALLACENIFLVECMSWEAGRAEELGNLMARMLGLVADDRALGFYIYPGMRTAIMTPEVLVHLKEGRLKEAFGAAEVPVVGVSPDDPRMIAATQEAHDRWPEFLEMLRAGNGEFYAKIKFEYEDKVEHMWVETTSVDGNRIHGKLGNAPLDIPFLKLHDEVDVSLEQMTDWMVVRDGEQLGGFSITLFRGD